MGQHICLGLILKKDLLLKYMNISLFLGKIKNFKKKLKVGGEEEEKAQLRKKIY